MQVTEMQAMDMGLEYDRKAVMRRPFFGDLFLLDLADGGRLVSHLAPASRLQVGTELWDSLSERDRDVLTEYLKSYETKPALIDTPAGLAFVFPYFMPAVSLAMLCLPRMDRKTLLKLAARDPQGLIFLSDSLRSEAEGRLRGREDEKKAYEDFQNWICDFLGVISRDDEVLASDPMEWIHTMSFLFGCPVSSVRQEPIRNGDELDGALMLALFAVGMMLARHHSPSRELSLTLEEKSCGCRVSLCLESEPDSEEILSELLWMDAIADRKRIPFELTRDPNGIRLRFCPMRKDWSFLGLKQDSKFDWD